MRWFNLPSLVLIVLCITRSPGALARECPRGKRDPAPVCSATVNPLYRPVEGQLNKPCTNSGKSFAVFDRLQNPHYDDCDREFRRAKSGRELPPVRRVINQIFRVFKRDVSNVKRIPNLLSAFLGQYIAHDLNSRVDEVPMNTTKCCTNGDQWPIAAEKRNSACCPIEIPNNDPDYRFSNPDFHCMTMIRSRTMPRRSSGPADQMNEVTAFIDHSNLYGCEKAVMNSLKSGRGGQMITDGNDILPEKGDQYTLGDARLTQTPQLQLLHSVFLREHNRIAK